MVNDDFDLYAIGGDLEVEELPQGNALDCVLTASSVSTASCPWTSAATAYTASTFIADPGTLTSTVRG